MRRTRPSTQTIAADHQLEEDGPIMSTHTEDKPCPTCGVATNWMERFPGDLCLGCWAVSPEGRRMPTADEVVRMWGGKA